MLIPHKVQVDCVIFSSAKKVQRTFNVISVKARSFAGLITTSTCFKVTICFMTMLTTFKQGMYEAKCKFNVWPL